MRINLFLYLLVFGHFVNAQTLSSRDEALTSLKFLEGKWSVSVRQRIGKEGPWEETQAQSAFISNGSFFQEDYVGTMQGKEVRYHHTFAYNIGTKQYQLSRVDFYHGGINLFEGNWDAERLVVTSAVLLPGARTLLLRLTYTKINADSFEIEANDLPRGKLGILLTT